MAVQPLAVRLSLRDDEALDSYLERLARANHIDRPTLLRLVVGSATHPAIDCTDNLIGRVAALSGQNAARIERSVLASRAGITPDHGEPGWRHAGRAWAPGRGTQLCPACLAADGAWRVTWRHPWVAVCLIHRTWLHAVCPTCGLSFRMQRSSPLRSVDAADDTCGNPGGARGRTCPQDLGALASLPAPEQVLASQERINAAIHHQPVPVLGSPVTGEAYLGEIRVLAVLLLHLACQDGAGALAPWADAARLDHSRSVAGRGARWGLAPPVDPALRGQALTAADTVLAAADIEDAVQRLGPWLDLTPPVPEGQLGWLADRTTMTPLLARLVMAATSTRRRLSTLLGQEQPIDIGSVPQILPADIYARRVAGLLDVTEATGRLFASLCLVRLGRPGMTWAEAAAALGLPPETGTKTARACSADVLCSAAAFVDAITEAGRELQQGAVEYRQREAVVRHLAARRRWYTTWARAHHPGSHAKSRTYAVTWLWTTYAAGAISTSPGWPGPSTAGERARYRRYTTRLEPDAQEALVDVAVTAAASRTATKGNAHGTAR